MPLGAYDEDSLRSVVAECQTFAKDMKVDDFDSLSEGDKGSLLIKMTSIQRNRDCALAYVQDRLDVLTKLRLEAGIALPEHIRKNMSPQETTFFRDYDIIFSDFMRDLRIDLTAQLTPPGDLYIEVRAKVDCGELLTENSGIVNLQAGTSHYLRASDVQHLISQGLLEHVG